MEKLKILEFADPVCTWCWGTSPIIRALEYRYGEQIEIEYAMVGMVDDIRTFNNRRLKIGGDNIELSNRNMLKHWLDASGVHGMPVEEHHFHLFSEKHLSTLPQCKAYIAARLCSPINKDGVRDTKMAHKYFRRLQEATAAEAMQTGDANILSDLSAVVGFDPEKFRELLDSSKVQQIYEEDKELAKHYGVESTPTFLLTYKRQELLLQGFTTYETIEHNIRQFTYGEISPEKCERSNRTKLTNENVAHYIEHYGSVYPVDIATAFGLKRHGGHTALNIESYEHLPNILDELIHKEKIAITPKANSYMIYSLHEGRTQTQERMHEVAGTY
ncbi:MAG: DsbA family protein [Bacteroidaceae bacterium]|nr:DsbA family protein [Bacteroidaceae bacterium]